MYHQRCGGVVIGTNFIDIEDKSLPLFSKLFCKKCNEERKVRRYFLERIFRVAKEEQKEAIYYNYEESSYDYSSYSSHIKVKQKRKATPKVSEKPKEKIRVSEKPKIYIEKGIYYDASKNFKVVVIQKDSNPSDILKGGAISYSSKSPKIHCPYCGQGLTSIVSICPFCGTEIKDRISEIEKGAIKK